MTEENFQPTNQESCLFTLGVRSWLFFVPPNSIAELLGEIKGTIGMMPSERGYVPVPKALFH
jgi:hypothetical protein